MRSPRYGLFAAVSAPRRRSSEAVQGLLAIFGLVSGLFKFFSDWLSRREIARACENEGLVQAFKRALQLLREGEEARDLRARLDADVKRLREPDDYRRGE